MPLAKSTIEKLLAENEGLPHKQRFTARKIFQKIQKNGYQGSEGSVRRYVAQLRDKLRKTKAYLPLEFSPGEAAQVDWGEATISLLLFFIFSIIMIRISCGA